MDEELRNQQQQSRQQRFQQEVQRQPAGLQSLFGALNPFHLLGRNRNNTDAAPAATQNGGSNSASQAQNSNVPAAGLPSATAERLDTVRSSLQELEVSIALPMHTSVCSPQLCHMLMLHCPIPVWSVCTVVTHVMAKGKGNLSVVEYML